MQNWRTELKVVVAVVVVVAACQTRGSFQAGCGLTRAFEPGSGAHLRICLGKLDSRLTCSLVASRFSTDSYPAPSNFPSLAPSTFHRAFVPRGGEGLAPWGHGENWTFVELSVNVLARLPFSLGYKALAEKSRKELTLGKLSSRWTLGEQSEHTV